MKNIILVSSQWNIEEIIQEIIQGFSIGEMREGMKSLVTNVTHVLEMESKGTLR